MYKSFFYSFALFILLSCNKAEHGTSLQNNESYNSVHVYECGTSFSFTAGYKADSVRLILPDQELLLPRVVSASGAKYQNKNVLFWNKGNEALIEYRNQSHAGCKDNPVKATWQKAKLAGVDFRAAGQEPGWILEINNDNHIRFTYNYAQDTVYTPVPKAVKNDSLTKYDTQTEAHQLTIEIADEPCTDSMNGATFPTTVAVTLDGEQFIGCGRFL